MKDQDNGKFSHDVKIWENYQHQQMLEMAGIKKEKKKCK